MEQFKALDEAWQVIELQAKERFGVAFVGLCDLRDRVAALEAEREATCKAGLQVADDLTPEPEPSDFQTLHGIALDMVDSLRPIVIPEILNVLRRAIREPMAEQQAATEATPEPSPSPAADGGLARQVAEAIGGGDWEIWEEESRDAILRVAKWLRSMGNFSAATNLEQEANR